MQRLLVFAILLAVVKTRAQTIAGRVWYRQVLNLNPTDPSRHPDNKKAILYYSDTMSYYVYNRREAAEPAGEKINLGMTNTLNLEVRDTIGEVFMTNFNKRQLFMREFIWQKPYTAIDTLVKINWIDLDEQKKIGGFICRKAKAYYRGRNYEAWYTNEIPVRAGPWKLQGLPGLILEAQDENNEVRFLFENIDILNREIFKLTPPANGKKVSLTNYRNLWHDETEKIKDSLQKITGQSTIIDIYLFYFPIEREYY